MSFSKKFWCDIEISAQAVSQKSTQFSCRTNSHADHGGRTVLVMGFDRLDSAIVGSNHVQGMDVCPRLSVFCCRV
jgi:hypothetical protein